MTDQPSATRDRFVHEACLYRSDDEVLGVVVPFLREAQEHGEAAVVGLDERKTSMVRRELGAGADGIEFVGGRWYTNPASAIREYLRCFESLATDGDGRRVRAVGELPPGSMNGSWSAWRRYEAAINVVFEPLPVWGICLFDGATARPEVVADVLCTHPRLRTSPGEPGENDLYTEPHEWLARLPPPPPHEAERTGPHVHLVDPAPHEARAAITPLARSLSSSDRDGLFAGVSEIVSNANAHGAPPVTVRAWARDGYVVVTVDDCGPGIHDPLAGLVAPHREMGAGGLGLWITHQLCRDVSLINTPGGLRVRIVAGGMGEPEGAGGR